jgi:hypothetical protein
LWSGGGDVSNNHIAHWFKDVVHSWVITLVTLSNVVVIVSSADVQRGRLQ